MPKKERQKMHNPMGNMGAPGMANIANLGQVPPMNFDNDALESELMDLLGEDKPKPPAKQVGVYLELVIFVKSFFQLYFFEFSFNSRLSGFKILNDRT